MTTVNPNTVDLNQLYQQATLDTQSSSPTTQKQAQKLTAEAMYAYAAQNPGATVQQASAAVSSGEQGAGMTATQAAKLTGNVVNNILPAGDDPSSTAMSSTHRGGGRTHGGGGGGGGGGGASTSTEEVMDPVTGQMITQTVQN